jgi:hypothetical protein
MTFRLLLVALLALSFSAPAAAHVRMVYPKPRHAGLNPPLKKMPCGVAGEQKPATAPPENTFRPGQTITVRFNEFIGHPGHFRIAFLADGDNFPEPTSFTDIKNPPVLPVLLDGILPHTDSPSNVDREATITLPNVTCTRCTLQLIQMMTDKPPYALDTNDIYHECADIQLVADSGGGGSDAGVRDGGGRRDGGRPPDARPPMGGTGGSAGTGGASGAGGGYAGTGGASGSAGSSPAPAAGSGGARPGGAAGAPAPTPPSSGSDSGGFCSIGGRDQRPVFALAFVGLVGAALWRTRSRRNR